MLSGAMLTMDSTTMVLVLALGNLVLCSALFFFDYGAVRTPSLASWGLSKQVQAASWILLALGGARVVPEPLALPGAWALLIAGVALESASLWETAHRRRLVRAMLPFAVGAILVFLASYWIDANGLGKLAAALILGAFYLLGAAALARGWREASMLQRALAVVTSAPAAVLGTALGTLQASVGRLVEGGVGDVCIVDPGAHWLAEPAALRSQGKHTPFTGYELPGRVRCTLVGGQIAFERSC